MFPVAILAGGLATRLRPLTENRPKALVEINGEPFLAHQLRLLKRRGISRVALCVGYLGEAVRDFAGDGRAFGLRIEYSQDWPDLRGTAGAVAKALPLLGERFFVLYGDSYLPCDYCAAQETFLASGRAAMMTVFANDGRWDASNVEFAGGRIVAYDKKQRSARMRHIDYGLGAFHRWAFENLAPDRSHDLTDIYQDLLRRGELAAFEAGERFYEIGSFEGIRELSEYLKTST
ncbi:MAG: nucleotidyltransferase family protein [Bryobacteraceae bacterium]|nr:nucleotidyltransferase family protein [Bryobacteraceae bacterium]